MKDEPAFKPLQGNPAFFRVRASRCPFHLRQQTQCPSHLPIAEGSLPLWSLRKVGLPLLSKPGNQLTSLEEFGCTELSQSCCVEIGVPLHKTGFSGNLWSCLKEVKPLFMYDVQPAIALEPMQENRPSSPVDLQYPSYFVFLQ